MTGLFAWVSLTALSWTYVMGSFLGFGGGGRGGGGGSHISRVSHSTPVYILEQHKYTVVI